MGGWGAGGCCTRDGHLTVLDNVSTGSRAKFGAFGSAHELHFCLTGTADPSCQSFLQLRLKLSAARMSCQTAPPGFEPAVSLASEIRWLTLDFKRSRLNYYSV